MVGRKAEWARLSDFATSAEPNASLGIVWGQRPARSISTTPPRGLLREPRLPDSGLAEDQEEAPATDDGLIDGIAPAVAASAV